MPRRLLVAPVRQVLRHDRLSGSRPADFVLESPSAVAETPVPAFPYCLDWLRARSVYVAGPTAQALLDAPFYYLKARQQAASVLSVPWEHGPIDQSGSSKPVIFIFSAGRVGSTLLHSILRQAGVAALSEPDFYSQAMLPGLRQASAALRRRLALLLGDLTQDLAARFCAPGRPLVIKLRAECCGDPELLLAANPGARAIFLTRNFEDWARSSLNVFRRTPRLLVKRKLQSIRCLGRLQAMGLCHLLHYEDMIWGKAEVFAKLAEFIGQDIPPEAMRAGLARDSQAGTPVARRPPKNSHDTDLARALALWAPHRAYAKDILAG